MVKKILIGLLLLLLVLVGLATTKPDTFLIEREITINAPPSKVFGLVNDFRAWRQWSAWETLDPGMQRTYTGAPAGVGSIYEWSGNSKAGAGKMEVVNATAPSKVEVKLDFEKPMKATNMSEMKIDSTATGTHVVWNMHGPNNFLSKMMTVFVSVDKIVGPDFERGLTNLKTAAEK
ncbi:MAG: SRPBCC family protein [Gemmatimonas sp.]